MKSTCAMRFIHSGRVLILFVLFLYSTIAEVKEPLKITLMISSGPQRTVFFTQVQQFQQEHPEWDVVRKEYEQERYKAGIEERISAKESDDVLFWFAGAKLRSFINKGWVANIDDLWNKEGWDQKFTNGSKSGVSYRGQTFGLPISYYQWGFYYRKSVFKENGLTPPVTWADFLQVAKTLKSKDIAPFTLGSKYAWTAAGWFDYLDLRINGVEFHQELMEGKVAYNDPRVKEVFLYWKELLDQGYFLAEHNQLDWRDALPYLYRGKAGMVLMGNFVVLQIPPSLLDDIGFFRFPKIKPEIGYAEEAPMDILVIPSVAKNKEGAKAFLAFMGRAEVQYAMNSAMGMISPNQDAPVGDDRLIQAGAQILKDVEGISQFYDRDTPKEMFEPGMEAMVEFMKKPEKVDQILDDLEAIRKKVFTP